MNQLGCGDVIDVNTSVQLTNEDLVEKSWQSTDRACQSISGKGRAGRLYGGVVLVGLALPNIDRCSSAADNPVSKDQDLKQFLRRRALRFEIPYISSTFEYPDSVPVGRLVISPCNKNSIAVGACGSDGLGT